MSSVVKKKKMCICFSAVIMSLKSNKNKPKKRKWCKDWLLKREEFSHMNLLRNLRENEISDFKNFVRMDDTQFTLLLELVKPYILKQNTVMRNAISAEERLIITLRYLATGRSYEDLKYSAAISPQALGKIIPETFWAIYKSLRNRYLKIPKTEQEWREVSNGFQHTWQFEHCLGAMDGKHIQIQKPANSGSLYYNYKRTFSVVLFAIVNSKYEFLYVHTGTNGRVSDGGLLKQTDFYKLFAENKLGIPPPAKLEHSESICPFTFIGDEAFPLKENLLKPYSQRGITREEHIFNYRLCRARRVVENAFGILSARFRIFLQPIPIKPESINAIVLASCVLHNFLKCNSQVYIPQGFVDYEDFENATVVSGTWRQNGEMTELQHTNSNTKNCNGKIVRNMLKSYYNHEGKVPFQYKMANVSEDEEI